MASIGMNLAQVNYWSGEEPFLDRFKTSGTWTIAYDVTYSGVGSTAPAPLDADGNPTVAPPAGGDLRISFQVDPPETMAAGTDEYVMTYDGTATFAFAGATIVSQTPGQVVFKVTTTGEETALLEVKSMDMADPLSNIHIVRADQVDLYNSGEIFNPAFVAEVKQWGLVRFMDWENINSSAAVSWDTRSTLSDSSWASSHHADGVPLEAMVALANEAHVDMWYNVPTQADDTYVTNALTYIRDNLDPDLKVHIEYSNEVWNSGFAAHAYAQSQANALWGVDTNGNGTIDAGEAVSNGSAIYYGYRSAQISEIAHDVFGTASDDRLEMVLAGQSANIGLTTYELTGIAKADAGSVSSLFDDYAITTYFGSELSSTNVNDMNTVVGWATSGSAGLDAAFHELEYGGSLSQDYSLAKVAQLFTAAETFAQSNGLDLVAYEGGASLVSQYYSSDVRAEVTAFFGELMNDPRMGDLYTKMVDEFAAAGGSELTSYNDVGTNSQYGDWGVLDTIYDDGSARYDALTAAEQADLASGGTSSASAAGSGVAATAPIEGTAAADHLYGTANNDVIYGGDGNDYIDGGAGADLMYGGAGNDIYIVDNSGDMVVEAAGGGTDEVRTALSAYALADNVENLTYTGLGGAFTGTGNDLANTISATATTADSALFGGDGADTLRSGSGNDYIDGGAGADFMNGGAGNDIYIVDNSGDYISEAAGGGTDEVRTTLASYSLPANVENLVYTGTADFTGNGNALDNVVTGGSGNDMLVGNDGNDTLIGGAGDDQLHGGNGDDTMIGGAGDDQYWVTDAGDTVVEAPDEGYDIIHSTISYRLPANVEELVLGVAGTVWANDQGDKITGSSGDDIIYGGLGDDTLLGGSGNDIISGGGGHDMMTGGAGADTFVFQPGQLSASLATTAQILDFYTSQGDKIDLSAIDANSATAARDAFHFVGTAAFSGTAGELRVVKDGSNYDVFGDTNGDGIADFALVVTSKTGMLAATDFLL